MKYRFLKVFLVLILIAPSLFSNSRQLYYVNAETYKSYQEFLRGVHYFNQERYEASIESFKASLDANPTDKFIRYWYSRALYKNGYMALSVNEWSNLERMGYTDPIILSKLEKYSTIPSEKTKEEIFSNFIYIKSFSTDADFLKNINQPIEIKMVKDGRMFVLDYSDSALKIFDVNGDMIQKIGKAKRTEIPQKNWFMKTLQVLSRTYPYKNMKNPRSFDMNSRNDIYIANTGGDNILKFDERGEYIKTLGISGVSNGAFLGPSSIFIDNDDKVYIADTGNNRVSIYNSNDEFILNFGKAGEEEGELFRPSGIAVRNGIVYVADTGNKRISAFDIYGNYIKSIENPNFHEPRGLSFDTDGNLFVADGKRVYYYNIADDKFTVFQNSERYATTPISVSEGDDESIYIADFLSGKIDVFTRKEQYYANLDVFVDRSYLSSFPSVVLSVTVRDRLGNGVKGLTDENFFVIENGLVNQRTAFYTSPETDKNRFIYLIEDSSNTAPYQDRMKEEINNFTQALSPDDEVLVIHYNDEIRTTHNYYLSRSQITENVNDFTSTGGINSLTQAVYDAIRLSGTSFKKTSIIHFTASSTDIESIEFNNIRFGELASFAKNNAVSISHVYVGEEDSNYFYNILVDETYGKNIDAKKSINYIEEINEIKSIDFGKYYIRYNSDKVANQIGDYRSVFVRVQFRDMYGEEESGYVVP